MTNPNYLTDITQLTHIYLQLQGLILNLHYIQTNPSPTHVYFSIFHPNGEYYELDFHISSPTHD